MGRRPLRACLLPIAVLLGLSLLTGCGVFRSAEDKAMAQRTERLRQPPDLSATSVSDSATAPAATADTAAQAPRAELIEDDAQAQLMLPDSFYEAWRRVGLAIDRLGFTLEDRNRADGQYFVRYDPRADQARQEPGFWSSLTFWRDEPDELALYVIQLAQDGGRRTRVLVADEAGQPAPAAVAERILALLYEQLR